MICPRPLPTLPPNEWPDLTLLAGTIYGEAEGEGYLGQLAVGWVIRNRMDTRHASAKAVILAPMQFSFWNEGEQASRVARFARMPAGVWESCWKAAAASYWKLSPDPTHGATHYLNPAVTRTIRPNHDLPAWYREDRVTASIGQHEFLIV